MGMGPSLTRRWRDTRDQHLAQAQGSHERAEQLAAVSRSFRMLLQSAILTLGAYLVIQGSMTGGMIIAASVVSGRALAPIDQIIGHWKAIARARGSHGRMLSAKDVMAIDVQPHLALPDPTGRIEVTAATRLGPARAGGEAPRILSEVTFGLEPGDGLAVLGPSGSGKSTLARLIVGATMPDAGEVRLDGATLDQWDQSRLGRRIGYLPQRAEMLPGTIRDNIARFDPEIPDSAVIAAAQAVGIHEMILRLPEGYATPVGHPGAEVVLSGGQMQRLGLARAVCGKPALVVLDEPDANLDPAGDAALCAAVTTLRTAGSTVVVMTHRAGVLAQMNKVLCLQNGRVVQFGLREDHGDNTLPNVSKVLPHAAPPLTPFRAGRYGPQHRRAALRLATRSDGPAVTGESTALVASPSDQHGRYRSTDETVHPIAPDRAEQPAPDIFSSGRSPS
jgi:PrtD family type I secretion system ABC transporter